MQIAFAITLILLVLAALSLLYDDVIRNVIANVAKIVAEGGIPSPEDNAFTAHSLELAKQKNMLLASAGVIALAAAFGYLITRVALAPTRTALASQKQFVGNIAHELRTPLSVLKTSTEVALFDEKLSDDLRETLLSNIEELDRMSSIINNLLSLNRLMRPEQVEFKNVDLKECIDSVLLTLADLIAHKKNVMEVHLAAQRTIWGNASGIEQILMNIIKNAMHYSPHGSRIIISVHPSLSGYILLSIEDNGPGIEEKDLAHIFEPFYRGDTARNRKSGAGSGLGLTIVSELVKMHRGRISMESAVGRGTRVNIFLPVGHPQRRTHANDGAEEAPSAHALSVTTPS